MVINPRQQLYRLGSWSVVGAVIDDENRFSIIICQAIEDQKYLSGQGQDQFTPIMPNPFEKFVGCIFAERQILVEDNDAIKVLAHKWQAEDRLCQRTNAVAMPFSDATLMKQSADPESIEKSVNLPVNTNVGLRLGGYLVMVHLSPFSLYLLWIFADPL